MDTKINLSQLAKALTLKKKMSQKDAEAFLRKFFDAIIQNVTTDKIVKVKGLGTFKLIEVLDRESVNVNTGERIVIPGHTKLSFTPDASLKDMVNKPFADFQTVVINEGTSLDEMEQIPQEVPSTTPSPEEEEEMIQDSEPQIQEDSSCETETDPMLEPGADATTEEVPFPKVSTQTSQPEQSSKKRNHAIIRIAIIILLCMISFYAGYKFYEFKYAQETKSVVQETKHEEPKSESADSLRLASNQPQPRQEEKKVEKKVEQEEEIDYAQVPGGAYKIIGTRKTYIMKPGDYLTKIALEEYGNKEFTRYIIIHNRFPDPNNVPVGAKIKLPELEKVE